MFEDGYRPNVGSLLQIRSQLWIARFRGPKLLEIAHLVRFSTFGRVDRCLHNHIHHSLSYVLIERSIKIYLLIRYFIDLIHL